METQGGADKPMINWAKLWNTFYSTIPENNTLNLQDVHNTNPKYNILLPFQNID